MLDFPFFWTFHSSGLSILNDAGGNAVKFQLPICARRRKSAAKRVFSRCRDHDHVGDSRPPLPLFLRVSNDFGFPTRLRASAEKFQLAICAYLRKCAANRPLLSHVVLSRRCRRPRRSLVFTFHFLAIPAILAIQSVGYKQTLKIISNPEELRGN